jgi:uncharacterized membrane protein YgdD (TMEM256/DUF423 family)
MALRQLAHGSVNRKYRRTGTTSGGCFMSPFRTYAVLAALSGGLSVAMGAFAAHGAGPAAKALLDTGARYEFMHAMASIASLTFWNWGARRARFAPPLFLLGTVLFAGSLYALAFGAPRWVGAITPVGGVLFLLGWLTLAWAGLTVIARYEKSGDSA